MREERGVEGSEDSLRVLLIACDVDALERDGIRIDESGGGKVEVEIVQERRDQGLEVEGEGLDMREREERVDSRGFSLLGRRGTKGNESEATATKRARRGRRRRRK